ncbi:MAG: 3-alpha domain-containing protein, partial [Planctomycetota bacterium]
FRVYSRDRDEAERLLAVPQLPESWRRWAENWLQKAQGR